MKTLSGLARRAIFGLVATALLNWTFASSASAQTARTLVVIAPGNEESLSTDGLLQALQSQLKELDVAVRVEVGGSSPPAVAADPEEDRAVLAFVWLVPSGDSLSVRFYEADGARLRERELPVRAEHSVSAEEVALVVRSAVSALLEKSAAESREEETPVGEPLPNTQPGGASSKSQDPMPSPLLIGLGADVVRYARATKVQAGATLILGWKPSRAPIHGGLSYTFFAPMVVSSTNVVFTLARHPVRAYFAGEVAIGHTPLFVGAGVDVILDPIWRRTTGTSNADASANATHFGWALGASVLLGWNLSSHVRFFGTATTEFNLNPAQQVLDGPESKTLVVPYRARPRGFLGLSTNLP